MQVLQVRYWLGTGSVLTRGDQGVRGPADSLGSVLDSELSGS